MPPGRRERSRGEPGRRAAGQRLRPRVQPAQLPSDAASTTPLARSLCFAWNRWTAACVCCPKRPSTAPGSYPVTRSMRCTSAPAHRPPRSRSQRPDERDRRAVRRRQSGQRAGHTVGHKAVSALEAPHRRRGPWTVDAVDPAGEVSVGAEAALELPNRPRTAPDAISRPRTQDSGRVRRLRLLRGCAEACPCKRECERHGERQHGEARRRGGAKGAGCDDRREAPQRARTSCCDVQALLELGVKSRA